MKASDSLVKTRIPVWLRIVIVFVCLYAVINLILFLSTIVVDVFSLNKYLDGYDSARNLLVESVVLLIATSATVSLVRRTIDRKTFASLGLSLVGQQTWALVALAAAVIILGVGTILLTVMNAISLEWNEFDISGQIVMFVMFFIVGFYEELLFRGYVLGNLLTVTNKYFALLVSAALFALFHLANEGITILSTLNLVLAGILLGVPYVLTQNLWFPILFHAFWNYIQGGVLGYKVSGLSLNSLLCVTPSEPALLSGGNFGFEGSVVCTILLAGAIAFFVHVQLPERLNANETR